MVAKSWNAGTLTFANPHLGRPARRRRRGVTEGVWRRSLPRHLSLHLLKKCSSECSSVPVWRRPRRIALETCANELSGDFSFAFWNTRRHSECSSLFQRSSRGSGRAVSEGGGHWAWRPAGSNRTGAGSRSAPPPRAGAAPVARRRWLAQSGVPVFRSVPGRSSVPGSGSDGRRPFWTPAVAPIDAQSNSASIAVLTASHRPAARPAGGRAVVWHTYS